MGDILWPLITALAGTLFLIYLIRLARAGKDPSKQIVPLMIVLGLSVKWLFFVVLPVVIVVTLLMERFAPSVLSALPSWSFLAVFFAAPLTLALVSARSLWRQIPR